MAVIGAGGDAGCTYADVEVGNLQESLPKSGFLTLVCHKPVTAMACIHSDVQQYKICKCGGWFGLINCHRGTTALWCKG